MRTAKISRWVRGFDKQHGNLVAEYRLPESWTLERLGHLLGVADSSGDRQMYGCYPIGEREIGVLLGDSGITSDLVAIEYFLESDAEQ